MAVRLISQARVDAWERRLVAAVTRAFDAQVAPFRQKAALVADAASNRRAVAAGTVAGLATLAVWNQDAWSVSLARTLQPEAEDVESEAGDAAAERFPDAHTWGFRPSNVVSQRAVALAAGAGAGIGERLRDAQTSVDPPPPVAIDAVLAGGAAILASTIGALAQAAANQAVRDVAQYASGYAGPLYYTGATSTWNTVGDDRVRPAHEDADGQTVPIDQPFDVGGESLMCPGDPAGSDENTINCRCWTTEDGLVEDESGAQQLPDGPAGELEIGAPAA